MKEVMTLKKWKVLRLFAIDAIEIRKGGFRDPSPISYCPSVDIGTKEQNVVEYIANPDFKLHSDECNVS
jgi:hypothetical protein